MKQIGLLSDDNGFMYEHFKIEGLDFNSIKNSSSFEGYKIIILNLDADKHLAKRLFDYVIFGGKVIVLKPGIAVNKQFGLKGRGITQKSYLNIEGKQLQIFSINNYKIKRAKIIAKTKEKIPAIFEKQVGKGKLIVVGFDLNLTLYKLLYGNDVIDDLDGDCILRVDDGRIVKNNELLFPQADVLRRFLVKVIKDNIDMPLPFIWYFPYNKKAAVTFSHDSDGSKGKELKTLLEFDSKRGIKPTLFVRPIDGTFSWNKLKRYCDIGLHTTYLYFPKASMFIKRFFVKFNRCFIILQKALFFIQKLFLQFVLKNRIDCNRTHGLVWFRLNDQPSWMSKSNVKFDSTLGSNYDYGYAYGTGLPYFLRRQDNYYNLDVLEIPLHLMDSALFKKFKGDISLISKASKSFIDYAYKYNSLVTIDSHYYLLKNKDFSEWYKSLISYCKNKDFLITTMTYFNDFWRKRQMINIDNLVWNKNKLIFLLESKNFVKGLTMAVPYRFKRFRVDELKVNNKRTKFYPEGNFVYFSIDASTMNKVSVEYAR